MTVPFKGVAPEFFSAGAGASAGAGPLVLNDCTEDIFGQESDLHPFYFQDLQIYT